MRSKAKLLLAIIALIAFGIWFYATPYLTVSNMTSAAESGDTVKLSSHVNFPALKDNLKGLLNAKLAPEAEKQEAAPLTSLGTALASTLIGPMVDTLVTPESLAMIIKGHKLPPVMKVQSQKAPDDSNTEISMSYESFNRFAATIKKKDQINMPISLILTRDGLFSWKLSALRMPK
jgi:hypothetical protein